MSLAVVGVDGPSSSTAGQGAVFADATGKRIAEIAGAYSGFRNRLINGGMRFWQRQTASVADDVYGFDRWNILTQTAAVTLSQLTDVENGTPYMMRITQGQASAQRFGVEQIVESINCKDLRGSTVIMSARVRCSNSTTLRYAILEWTGTADSVTSDVVNSWTSGTFTAGNFFLGSNLTVTATGSTALTANTLTDVSLSATLGSSMNNLIVLFWTDSTQAQNSTLDIGKAQLEPGAVATPFERRHHQTELHLCQRYYVKTYAIDTAPGTVTSTGQYAGIMEAASLYSPLTPIALPVDMFAPPTATIYSPATGASGKIRQVNAGADVTAVINAMGVRAASANVENVSTNQYETIACHFTMVAEL
jgi:hypothetical protein